MKSAVWTSRMLQHGDRHRRQADGSPLLVMTGEVPVDMEGRRLPGCEPSHARGTAWSTKRYLNIELLKDQQIGSGHGCGSRRRRMRGAITA